MAKKIHPDGHVTYYYHKKKIGRPKKRGPKKKPKKKIRPLREPWDFKIILCNFKKREKHIGTYHNAEEVEYACNKLKEMNAQVIMPSKYINNGRNSPKVYELLSEYVVMKKVRNGNESLITQIRDEYGRLVDHKATSDGWVIYDKFPCLKEETFWAYGYSPKMDRKDISWIMENFIDVMLDQSTIVQTFIYLNKVIFKYDDDFNFVICKNRSDAIRMYNIIEERYRKNKRVIFTGIVKGERANYILDLMEEKTGWTRKKLYTSSTRA